MKKERKKERKKVYWYTYLVLEHVTLDLEVKLMVQVAVELLGSTVLGQHPPEDPHATHPDHLTRETGFAGTLTLTQTHVSAQTLGGVTAVHTRTGVDSNMLLYNVTILDEFAAGRTRVGIGNFVAFVGVQPDFPLSAPMRKQNQEKRRRKL